MAEHWNGDTPTIGFDHERARSLFERFYQLLNERDVRHIPAIFTEDIVFQDDAWPEIMRGHADVERFLTALWRAVPDFRFELVEGPYLGEYGRRAAARVRVGGTLAGDWLGYAPTGARWETDFAGFYVLEGDRIKRERVIANANDVAIQVGALPPHGSLGERLAVAIQRLDAWRMRRR
jgi:steroid delta-isomerase-like uncharacterized protein